MSSPAVREAFRLSWNLPTIPLVDTINDQPTDLETDVPLWATFTFVADEQSHQTMGSKPWITERGVVSVLLHSYSGLSDLAISQAAEEIRKRYEMWINGAGSIWVENIGGPRPPDDSAVGDSYAMALDLNYVHQYRGG